MLIRRIGEGAESKIFLCYFRGLGASHKSFGEQGDVFSGVIGQWAVVQMFWLTLFYFVTKALKSTPLFFIINILRNSNETAF